MLNYKIVCPFCGEILEEGKPKAIYNAKLYECNGKKCLPGKVVVSWTPHESIISITNTDFDAIKDEIDFDIISVRKNCFRCALNVKQDVFLMAEKVPKKPIFAKKKIEKPKPKKTTIKKEYKEGEK